MVAASSSSRALCSRAWWPQKRSSPPLGRTARTDAAAPHRSPLSAAVSAAGLARIPVMSSSHLRPPRTAAYVYLYSDATGAGSVPSEANALHHIYLPAIKMFGTGTLVDWFPPRTNAEHLRRNSAYSFMVPPDDRKSARIRAWRTPPRSV